MSDEWKPMDFGSFFPGREEEFIFEFIDEGYPATQLLHAEVNQYGQEHGWTEQQMEEQYEELFEEIQLYADAMADEAYEYEDDFADPGGNSALRAESPDNPRCYPCPSCGGPNRLTKKDVDLGYQCNECAARDEAGY